MRSVICQTHMTRLSLFTWCTLVGSIGYNLCPYPPSNSSNSAQLTNYLQKKRRYTAFRICKDWFKILEIVWHGDWISLAKDCVANTSQRGRLVDAGKTTKRFAWRYRGIWGQQISIKWFFNACNPAIHFMKRSKIFNPETCIEKCGDVWLKYKHKWPGSYVLSLPCVEILLHLWPMKIYGSCFWERGCIPSSWMYHKASVCIALYDRCWASNRSSTCLLYYATSPVVICHITLCLYSILEEWIGQGHSQLWKPNS